MTKNLLSIAALGIQIEKSLINGNLTEFAHLMNEHWEFKRKRTSGMTNSFIDDAYAKALRSGAIGGKLVGAGGGGFLMFYTESKEKLRTAMAELGLEEVRFKFDFEGTKVILS
jgi:D-glycero-alpha-D-manno-heptose-7-phosphate kinase